MKKILYVDKQFLGNKFHPLADDVAVLDISGYKAESDVFSAYIGAEKTAINKKINLYYLLEQPDDVELEQDNIFFVACFEDAIRRAAVMFSNCEKRILIYGEKFPLNNYDVDGGSITTKQLIDTLKYCTQVELAFIRHKKSESFADPWVRRISYFEYEIPSREDKFEKYLNEEPINHLALKDCSIYDHILVIHPSHLFGIDEHSPVWKQVVLFPMFCTRSYLRAGHIVPAKYIEKEKAAIEHSSKIITPSEEEKKDLLADYNCREENIIVIPRGVASVFKYRARTSPKGRQLKLLAIGSIKPQKNNMEQLFILKRLLSSGIDCVLHAVGTVQDEKLYRDMKAYIQSNNLSERVFFHISISQKDLAALCDTVDVNFSTSKWETFGRGIFEGVCAGLPTVVYDKLSAVRAIAGGNGGIVFASDEEDMISKIGALYFDASRYEQVSAETRNTRGAVSYRQERERLYTAIMGGA